ncbi:hypothetical protein BGW39_011714 [Mortierella sp. 14UC]|nr:hypothetical protein BGW39_011714 [Mortierella sp. 14UC]
MIDFKDILSRLERAALLRIEDYNQAVYIPPSAKLSLQAQDDTMSPLLEKVTEFLAGDGPVMLILRDSGAEKSTFNRHLKYTLWQDYTASEPTPLFINLPALDRPDKDVMAEQLRSLDISENQIRDLRQHRRFVLICDGYDESQLTANLYTTNLLNQPGQWNAKLIITCRIQYLGPSYRDRFGPQGERNCNISAQTLFQEVVITLFPRKQIEAYAECYAPLEPRIWVKKDYMDKLTVIPGLMGLVTNPLLLILALGALPGVVLASIFQEQDGRFVIDYNHRRDKDYWKAAYFGLAFEWTLLRSASLLSRVGNQYRFVHKSVLEYSYSCMICPSTAK